MLSHSKSAPLNGTARWLTTGFCLALSACANQGIWNAGDLADWVRDRAVDQGCQRDSIELESSYTETAAGNVWCGTCRDARGKTKSFGVNVDPVWKPSKSTS
jgi:hypothetical protein